MAKRTNSGCVGQDGCIEVPSEAGLGVSYDTDYIREHAIATRVYQ